MAVTTLRYKKALARLLDLLPPIGRAVITEKDQSTTYPTTPYRAWVGRKSYMVVVHFGVPLRLNSKHIVYKSHIIERELLGDLAHEIAHYIVAPPERRLVPDFGLTGEEPNEVEEEKRAVILASYITHQLLRNKSQWRFPLSGPVVRQQLRPWWHERGVATATTFLQQGLNAFPPKPHPDAVPQPLP